MRKNYIAKLARSGMKGRKRDTFVLRLVVSLSFAFIVLATLLLGSIRETKVSQRESLYGKWQVANLNCSQKVADKLTGIPDTAAKSVLMGEFGSFGTIGTLTDELVKLGNFTLLEGRMPKSDNEIVIEAKQLGLFPDPVKVGDTVPIDITLDTNSISQKDYNEYYDNIYDSLHDRVFKLAKKYKSIKKLKSEFKKAWKAEKPITICWNYGGNAYVNVVLGYDYYEMMGAFWERSHIPYGSEAYDNFLEEYSKFKLPLNKLSENEFNSYFYDYVVSYLNQQKGYQPAEIEDINHTETDLINYKDDILMTLRTEMLYLYNSAEYKVDPGTKLQDDIIKKGVVTQQHLIINRKYTVVGIVNTYSDRWDTADYTLPNTFITQSCGDELVAAVKSIKDQFVYAPNYDFSCNVFMADDSKTETELYNAVVKASSTTKSGDKKEFNAENYSVVYFDYNTGKNIVSPLTDIAKSYGLSPRNFYSQYKDSEDFSFLFNDDSAEKCRINRYTFPLGDSDVSLKITVFAIIFVTTACAIFQIFITQIKRRTRKIALLKSVGATNSQIGSMLLYEGVFLLLVAMPIGVAAGFALGGGTIAVMNIFNSTDSILFFVDVPSVLIGVALCAVALFMGMFIPMLAAVKTRLVGSISVDSKPKRKLNVNNEHKMQSYRSVAKRHTLANSGRNIMFLAIECFIISIMLISTYLSFSAFSDYNTTIVKNNRPDFTVEQIYAMPRKLLSETLSLIEESEVKDIERIEAFTMAERVYMNFDGMLTENSKDDEKKGSVILDALQNIVPEELYSDHFVTRDDAFLTKHAGDDLFYSTEIYCVNSDTELFTDLLKHVSSGSVDIEKYDAGNEVIVLVPLYLEGNNYDDAKKADLSFKSYKDMRAGIRPAAMLSDTDSLKLTFDSRYKGYYKTDNALSVGDTLELQAITETVKENVIVKNSYGGKYKVGAISNYFGDRSIWPFGNDICPYTVICSQRVLNDVYPRTITRYTAEEIPVLRATQKLYFPTCNGKTYINVYTKGSAKRDTTDIPLLNLCHAESLTFTNYRDSNSAIYNGALNNTLIISMLGLLASLLAFVIFYNSVISATEQDRKRFGILQSMGVTTKEFLNEQKREGLKRGIIAVIFANALILIIFALTTLVTTKNQDMTLIGYVNDMLQNKLWLYPYILHFALCIAFVALSVYSTLTPLKKILKCSPVENIRS